MIKTNFIMKSNRMMRVIVRVMVYFILNLPPQTSDATCSRLYLDGKSMRRKCQMNNLVWKRTNNFVEFQLKILSLSIFVIIYIALSIIFTAQLLRISNAKLSWESLFSRVILIGTCTSKIWSHRMVHGSYY